MPIYAYRCSNCGHAKDVLQKISDPVLTVCPECGQTTYVKQVTAAGFQLKGSGWYVTDFRGGDSKTGKPVEADDGVKVAGKGEEKSSEAKGSETASKSDASSSGGDAAKKSESAPVAAPAPAASSPTPAAPAPGASGKTGG